MVEKTERKINQIDTFRLRSLSREAIVLLLTGEGVQIYLDHENKIINYKIIENKSEIKLLISDEYGEFAYYKLEKQEDSIIIKNKKYTKSTNLEGKGVIKLGFSLIAEYARSINIKKITGRIRYSNHASIQARNRALDLTNGGIFESNTEYEKEGIDLIVTTNL